LRIAYKDPDFSTGRRIGAGFLNVAGGLGSYTMGDVRGGIILSSGYVVAAGLIVWEIFGLSYDDPASGVPGAIGLGTAGVTAALGFVLPFLHHKPNPQNAFAQTPGRLNIVVRPDAAGGGKAVYMSYTWNF
jgi:hypothetical protein